MFKNLLNIKDLSVEDIKAIFSESDRIAKYLRKGQKSLDVLKGKSIMTLFYENSTRTRVSFENAANFLGATVTSVNVATSSVQKGETLIDTAETLDSMQTDLFVMRHSISGASDLLAKTVEAKVINAGDGLHAHPTQALLDMYTMREHFGSVKGLTVTIIGDVKHSRVARSNIYGLSKMGATVKIYGPNTLIPEGIENMPCTVCHSLEEAFANSDIIMALRIQLERQQKGLFPSVSEYHKYFGINDKNLQFAKKDVAIMHPGPVNRNVEVAENILSSEKSLINRQVHNGLITRMGILNLMLGKTI